MVAFGLGRVTIVRIFDIVMTSHVGRLSLLPGEFKAKLATGISRLFCLPHNRIPVWLFTCSKHLGLISEVGDLQRLSMATMSRIHFRSSRGRQ